mmetsp:Transcript_349/g.812  ORF Transcript_349/g.812 Transcript_349/m.812 type:complete len:128 (+) Transcript_349:276-659(+)|eukprot:CAMPEP_0119545766 /NCGR_PEP_ID=MMETSP1352-20130426/426_1 /TAXON_ID=265584 /ORGANISM="Stauroneis constricta, Strain CCMP1120" /LENGTH=127 /DNA_ID=CAMNT_0007590365 /DNA_START=263 /DNA_END=646 /DNA_ORIENTATION=+
MASVIDWSEAMQQCGDDEEFLRELLDDLRSETETQMERIKQVISAPDNTVFISITRAAHVIKGAAANLMCGQLKETAMHLEKIAQKANADPASSTANPAVLAEVKQRYEDLAKAVKDYNAYLASIGV